MSNFDHDLLSRELHERSHDVGGHPIGLTAVKQSARRIQRRRRVAAGAVALITVGIAVPTAFAVTDGTRTAPEPVSPPPTVIRTPDGPVTMTLEGLPRGEDPQVSYFLGADPELVTPDGRLPVPVNLQGVAAYDGGWIGLGYDGRGEEMFLLDSDMNLTHRFPSAQTFTVSSESDRVGYVEVNDDGSQTLVSAPVDGTDPVTWSFPERPPVSPVGFVDDDTLLFRTEARRPGLALAAVGGGTTPVEGFIEVSGTNTANGLVAGQTRSKRDGSGCFGVMDPASSTTEMLWETCDHSLGAFSPNGQFVLASDPYQSGLGQTSVSILDAQSGDLVTTFQQRRGSQIALTDVAWEGSDTVLAIAQEGTTWTMLRMTVTGKVEHAVEPFEGDAFADFPIRFATPR